MIHAISMVSGFRCQVSDQSMAAGAAILIKEDSMITYKCIVERLDDCSILGRIRKKYLHSLHFQEIG